MAEPLVYAPPGSRRRLCAGVRRRVEHRRARQPSRGVLLVPAPRRCALAILAHGPRRYPRDPLRRRQLTRGGRRCTERLRQAPESLAGAWVEQALVHPARAVVRAAADLCVDRGWTRCIAPALGALDAATDLRTRTALFRVLLLDVDVRGVDRLESALRGALTDAVVSAAHALAATEQRMEKAHRDRLVLALAARARDEQAAIRAAVLPALARLAPGERAALMVAALADPVPAVRAACIEAMAISGHPRLLSALVDALAEALTAEVARALLGTISRNESPETEAVMLGLLTSRPRALAADDVEAALIARAPLRTSPPRSSSSCSTTQRRTCTPSGSSAPCLRRPPRRRRQMTRSDVAPQGLRSEGWRFGPGRCDGSRSPYRISRPRRRGPRSATRDRKATPDLRRYRGANRSRGSHP